MMRLSYVEQIFFFNSLLEKVYKVQEKYKIQIHLWKNEYLIMYKSLEKINFCLGGIPAKQGVENLYLYFWSCYWALYKSEYMCIYI